MIHDQNKYQWSDEVKELEQYFAAVTLPTIPVRLAAGSTVVDSTNFVNHHIATLKATIGNRTFYPYLTRLRQFKEILETQD